MQLITVHVVNNICTPQKTAPQDIFTEYQDVFQGLGCLPGEYHLEVDKDVQPVKHTPRRVAIPLKAELKAHIADLEKEYANRRYGQQPSPKIDVKENEDNSTASTTSTRTGASTRCNRKANAETQKGEETF
ncbi:predicted protein [Nematostella vectensis]|uniref:Uncharacterized protein n=1 Tax=Nematostella vectensis TaxID=45351 RepID=A7SL05_NEMVE|nr:predicted protein [Nematostella vectensis]|eukprot:XP_001627724.1 predicted protein [Nematostella vectensis]